MNSSRECEAPGAPDNMFQQFWLFPGTIAKTGGPRFDAECSSSARIEHLGVSRTDIEHIELTHMNVDHTGSLEEFGSFREVGPRP